MKLMMKGTVGLVKSIRSTVLAACLLALAPFANAGMISFVPTPALGNVGGTISVDLVWTGGASEYIGDFDVNISWDSAIADWTSIAFDPDFGLDTIGGFFGEFEIAPGNLDIFGVSFDAPAGMVANQDSLGNTFRLATIVFDALAVGETSLMLSENSIGDEFGDAISPNLANGRLCVGAVDSPAACADVPEPAPLALLLLGLGLQGLVFRSRRRKTA